MLKAKSLLFRIVILFCSVLFTTSATEFKILEQSENEIIILIKTDELCRAKKALDGEIFDLINIKGFGRKCSEGIPDLPYKGLSFATDKKSDFKITILDSSIEFIENLNLAPDQGADVIAPNDYLIKKDFIKSNGFYKTNSFYPKSPVMIKQEGDFKGVNIVTVAINPVQYNPVKKTIKLHKMLKVKFEFNSCLKRDYSNSHLKHVKNIAINLKGERTVLRNDKPLGSIIITKTRFLDAASKLSKWQMLKGYNVTIDAKGSWTKNEIASTINSWYSTDSIDASYMILLGDMEEIPPHGMLTKTAYQTYTGPTDHYYSCINDGDYYSDIARGRIPASTPEEAMNAVDKIIRFEMNPPQLDSYYQQTLGAAYLQDNDKNQWWPENAYGYADRRFAQTIEEINLYLESKGYSFKRVFNTNAEVVDKWNLGKYSWGEPVPDYLKPPQFNWDGETEDILNTFNNGAFLAYHYDHGYEDGWADPSFTVNDMSSLTNDSLLPIIYSINCLTGKFNHGTKCFAERMIGDSAVGAAGVVAATNLSYSGWNEAFLLGMIDATWPGISLSTPNTEDPIITDHEPVYKIGDIMNQGLFRMTETWTNTYSEDYDEYHFQLYHCFGDPTTRIWTKVPTVISPLHSLTINPIDESFFVNGVNILDGMVTLYKTSDKNIVGRSAVNEGQALIALPNNLKIGDTLLLTITGQDVRPYQKSIPITNDITQISIKKHKEFKGITINNTSISINKDFNGNAVFNIYDIRGRSVYTKKIDARNKRNINLKMLGLSNGNYFIEIKNNDIRVKSKLSILN